MSDWIQANPMRCRPYMDRELEVWLDDNSVRKVKLGHGFGYRFTDCTHPMQNAICDIERIRAFRILEKDRQ